MPMQFMFSSVSAYTQGLIASSMDDVRIDIHSNNNIFSVDLDKYQTYQFRLNNSGFDQLVYSNGSVTALYEENLLYINSTNDSDLAFEQLQPIKSWGTTFIIPSLIGKSNNVFRITTGNYSVRILINNGTHHQRSEYILPFNFKDIYFKTSSMFLQSDKPVQVVQFCTSYVNGNTGDPFITVVPPLTSFLTGYIFKPMDGLNTFNHYVTLTVESKYASGLLLNDKSLSIQRAEPLSTQAGSYKILTLVVSTTTNILCHVGGHEFGALLYGYYSATAYGYPLGMKLSADYRVEDTEDLLKTEDAQSNISEEIFLFRQIYRGPNERGKRDSMHIISLNTANKE
ncbi:uncharacterized protein LOC128555118 isoform X1 [Mercenaria mercenaria]|uniref:uncharacterized protein LOC128555118 isoform X1 n=1 Tax=Mercenaria mercenaria TaxID=6596 RepID=UPI00234EB9E1|nr:uncharacterized protein LOC128555118 isoform X1 [Mercenaria mercenaria]XP_053392559.1 uncharacterized protein LOC128555118 isoform X1 [Mercenaria mercenaria]